MKSFRDLFLILILIINCSLFLSCHSARDSTTNGAKDLWEEEPLPTDSPLLRHPVAIVKKLIGGEAFLTSHANSKERKPLKEGMEIWLFDQIETGKDTQLEIDFIERKLLLKDTIDSKSLKFSSINFLRVGSNAKGRLKYFPLTKGDQPMLVWILDQGKILFHLDLQEHQIATRTSQIDVRPWGDIYLVQSSDQGSWVGVLAGAVDVTLRQRKPTTWIVHLIRGEQLFGYQIGAINLDLDTDQRTENNYPINQIRKTESLITKFSPFPPASQKALSVWGDRQEYRFEDYVRTRNEQRRDLRRTIERILPSTSENTIEISSPPQE